MARTSSLTTAPPFELPTQKGELQSLASFLARGPVLLAFHGRGEALKGPDRGARGWVDDYALTRAMRRLSAPPLTAADFESFVAPERLERLNASLKARPYRGLIVVCPYTPDVLRGDEPLAQALPLAQFVEQTLLPKIQR